MISSTLKDTLLKQLYLPRADLATLCLSGIETVIQGPTGEKTFLVYINSDVLNFKQLFENPAWLHAEIYDVTGIGNPRHYNAAEYTAVNTDIVATTANELITQVVDIIISKDIPWELNQKLKYLEENLAYQALISEISTKCSRGELVLTSETISNVESQVRDLISAHAGRDIVENFNVSVDENRVMHINFDLPAYMEEYINNTKQKEEE